MAVLLGQQIADIDTRIKEIDVKLTAMHKANVVSQRMATIPGVGPIIALTLAIETDPTAFESGRPSPPGSVWHQKNIRPQASSEWAELAGRAMNDCAPCSSLTRPR
jgi:transposase